MEREENSTEKLKIMRKMRPEKQRRAKRRELGGSKGGKKIAVKRGEATMNNQIKTHMI